MSVFFYCYFKNLQKDYTEFHKQFFFLTQKIIVDFRPKIIKYFCLIYFSDPLSKQRNSHCAKSPNVTFFCLFSNIVLLTFVLFYLCQTLWKTNCKFYRQVFKIIFFYSLLMYKQYTHNR